MKPIRRAQERDLSRMAEILIFNYRLYFYPIFQNDDYYFNELQTPAVASELAGALPSLWVYDDGAVKGFLQLEGAEIRRLFVEPVLHGQAIGAALLEHAVSLGADRLWALEKNRDAVRFYARHGFRETEQRRLEDGTEEHLILLRRTKE